ncbi:hypothetical protein Glove_18g46 [Diversispora epigaea]|uniref:Crinkler effector protein N-terminal domain-containing protein n=1 Tax=Diversispora epigaea TaxID=1348612 RepID=A0A397JXN4_9GLOM|nr:hypothetical protein Glove_18g46 [Diversispora epigaea]
MEIYSIYYRIEEKSFSLYKHIDITFRKIQIHCFSGPNHIRNIRKREDPTELIFPVEINNSQTTEKLKKFIRTRKKNTFSHVDANQLELWKVDICQH